MNLYVTILLSRLRTAITSGSAWFGVLIGILVLVFSLLYGLGAGYLLSRPDTGPETRTMILRAIAGYALLLVISSDLIPNFRIKTTAIPGYWPVSWKRIWAMDLAFEFFRLPMLALFTFYAGTLVFPPLFLWPNLFGALATGVSAVLATDALRTALRFQLPRRTLFRFASALVLAAQAAAIALPDTARAVVSMLLGIAAVALSALTYFHRGPADAGSVNQKDTAGAGALATRYLWRTPALRNNLLFGLLFKLFIPVYLTVFIKKMNGAPAEFFYTFFMSTLVSPLTVFTYIGANFWGVATPVWYRFRVSGARPAAFIAFQIRALGIFLGIDALFTLVSMYLLDALKPAVFPIYLANLLTLFLLAQWLQLWFPRRIIKTVSLRQNNVHPSYQITAMLLVMFNFFAGWKIHPALAWVIPALLLLTFWMDNPYHAQNGRRWSHQYYRALYKPE